MRKGVSTKSEYSKDGWRSHSSHREQHVAYVYVLLMPSVSIIDFSVRVDLKECPLVCLVG